MTSSSGQASTAGCNACSTDEAHRARQRQISMATYDRKISTAATFTLTPDGGSEAPTVVMLDDILGRMAGHEYKKSALLRSLHSWRAG